MVMRCLGEQELNAVAQNWEFIDRQIGIMIVLKPDINTFYFFLMLRAFAKKPFKITFLQNAAGGNTTNSSTSGATSNTAANTSSSTSNSCTISTVNSSSSNTTTTTNTTVNLTGTNVTPSGSGGGTTGTVLGSAGTSLGALNNLGSSVIHGSVSQEFGVSGVSTSSGMAVGSLAAASSLASLLRDTSPVNTSQTMNYAVLIFYIIYLYQEEKLYIKFSTLNFPRFYVVVTCYNTDMCGIICSLNKCHKDCILLSIDLRGETQYAVFFLYFE